MEPEPAVVPARRSERLWRAGQDVEAPPQERRHAKWQKHSTNADDPIPEGDPPRGETNPARVNQPISALVHNDLKNAWRINKALPMCFIFDAVSPACQFKRGMPFTDDDAYPRYPTKEDSDGADDITETDGDPPGWMPYKPRVYTYVQSACD